MKFVNCSNNTIYLEDIDYNIPFYEDFSQQEINVDNAKKSRNFRLLVALGQIKIVKHENSLFERGLIKMQENAPDQSANKKEEDQKNMLENNNELSVKIRGHFYEAGGYAKVNRNLAIALDSLGVNVEIDPTRKTENHLTEEEVRQLTKISKRVGRNAISIDSMIPTFSSMSAGGYRILYTTVEAGSIPDQFVDVANQYNEIWVTSDFCKKVLKEYNINRPIYVIPDSVNVDLYKPSKPYKFKPKLKSFVFISVFGWSYRKGYDLLLRSFLEEFSADDPVSLLIVSRFSGSSKQTDMVADSIKKYIDQYGGEHPPHIAKCCSVIPENLMPNLYSAANAFVLFSRGEGFCVPYIESSLCGLPVIATNVSGHTMFLNKENSFLVDVDKISPMETGLMHVHYWDDQLFPQLKSKQVIKEAKEQMRYVFENYEEAKIKNNKLQEFIRDNYSLDIVGQKAKDRLNKIWEKIS